MKASRFPQPGLDVEHIGEPFARYLRQRMLIERIIVYMLLISLSKQQFPSFGITLLLNFTCMYANTNA
jgi:hypothetical protein